MKAQKNRRRIVLALIFAYFAWIIGGFFWAVQKERNLTWGAVALEEGEHQFFFSLPKGTYIVRFLDDPDAELSEGANEVHGLNSEIYIRDTRDDNDNALIEHSSDHSVRFTVSERVPMRSPHQIDVYISFPHSDREFVYFQIRRRSK